MAIGGTVIYSVISATGSDTNGGGFDYTYSLSSPPMSDGAATSANTASPVFTSASYTFLSRDVGYHVYITSNTGGWISGWYKIASVASGQATLTGACATVASPTSANWGMDYSQIATGISLTNVTSTTGTGNLTAGSAIFSPGMVGNLIHTTSGWYEIVTYTNTTHVSVDRVVSPVLSSATITLGGSFATVKNAYANGATLFSGTGVATIFCTGSETTSATITATTPVGVNIYGYSTVRGDNGQYTITATANMAQLFATSANNAYGGGNVCNITFNGGGFTANTSSTGYVASLSTSGSGVIFQNVNITNIGGGAGDSFWLFGHCKNMRIYGNSNTGYQVYFNNTTSACTLNQLECYNNSASSVVVYQNNVRLMLNNCLFYNNAASCTTLSVSNAFVTNCTIYMNGSTAIGVYINSAGGAAIVNKSIVYNSSNSASSYVATCAASVLGFYPKCINVAYYNCAVPAQYSGTLIHLTADPCVNAAGGNFALKTSGPDYGKLINIATVYGSGNSTDYSDIGAAQHQWTPCSGYLGSFH